MKDSRGIQWLMMGGLIIAVYCVTNILLPLLPVGPLIATYVIRPALWGLLAWVSIQASGYRPAVKVRNKSTFIQLAFIVGLMQVMAYGVGGLFLKLGKSPSAFTPTGVLGNLIYVAAMLAGMEFSRAWLVHKLGRRHVFLAIFFVAVFYTLLSQPLSKITHFTFSIDSIPDNSVTWLPALGENLLATTLALFAGPRASLAYRGILAAFWWFCPILPDLDWTLKTLIGVVVPIMGMAVVNSFYAAESSRGQPRKRAKQTAFPAGTVITAVVCVLLVWFAVGALPFQPSVIPSGSMIPVFYPGDIVIVAKIQTSTVKLGDIVEYRNQKEKINVVHRVIEIDGRADQKSFIFKGDNNQSPDIDPVAPQSIIGKVVSRIPKIGWVSIYMKTLLGGKIE